MLHYMQFDPIETLKHPVQLLSCAMNPRATLQLAVVIHLDTAYPNKTLPDAPAQEQPPTPVSAPSIVL